MKIKTIFQISFCILSVLSVIAATVLGVVLGLTYALYGLAAAVLFACAMLLCKYCAKEKEEQKPDFLNSPEENERINVQNADQNENSSPEEK